MKKLASILIAAFVLCLLPSTFAAAQKTDMVFVNEAAGPAYTVTVSGLDASGSWKKESANGLTFSCNGDFSKFIGVKLNGALLDPSKYTAKAGSTIITIKPEHLDTLPAGKHSVEIMFTDGSVETEFTILAADTTTEPTDPKDKDKTPNTGDDSNPILWLWLGGASLAMLCGMTVIGWKRKRQGTANQ